MHSCYLSFTRYILNLFIHLKITHLFSLRRFRTVETIPICDLETVEPQEITIKVSLMFYSAYRIFVIQVVEKKKQFNIA